MSRVTLIPHPGGHRLIYIPHPGSLIFPTCSYFVFSFSTLFIKGGRKEGACQLLQKAIEAKVDSFLENYRSETDEHGHRLAVRNGYHKERSILTSMGPVEVKQPRVDDRKLRERYPDVQFSSNILPKYLRRIPTIDNLVPALYLKGISTQDFPTALAAILGDSAKNLSSNTIVRQKTEGAGLVRLWFSGVPDWAVYVGGLKSSERFFRAGHQCS